MKKLPNKLEHGIDNGVTGRPAASLYDMREAINLLIEAVAELQGRMNSRLWQDGCPIIDTYGAGHTYIGDCTEKPELQGEKKEWIPESTSGLSHLHCRCMNLSNQCSKNHYSDCNICHKSEPTAEEAIRADERRKMLDKLKDCRRIVKSEPYFREESMKEKTAKLQGWDMAIAVVESFNR